MVKEVLEPQRELIYRMHLKPWKCPVRQEPLFGIQTAPLAPTDPTPNLAFHPPWHYLFSLTRACPSELPPPW